MNRINNLIAAKNDQAKRLEYLINESGSIEKSQAVQMIQDIPANLEKIAKSLIDSGKIIELDNNYLSLKYCSELLDSLINSVRNYHKQFSSESGMPLESANFSRALINLAVDKKLIVQENNKLRAPDFVPENDEAFTRNKELITKICMTHKWQLITIDELKREINLPDKTFTKLIQAMRNKGELALIPEGYILIADLEKELREIIKSFGEKFTLAQVRDATGSTRKFILPILEYFDSRGFTRRAGDYRVVL